MTRRVTLATCIVLLVAAAAGAQTTCEDALAEARKSYDLGAFEQVRAQLAPCLGTAIGRRLAVDVHRLLALAYLYDDQPEAARKEVATLLRLDPTFDATSPSLFAELVASVRRETQVPQVASVSKTSESLREAPATVVVITGEEIQRRGYLDLEQLLHDLPGFDISRVNGDIYSTIYQRGYRSPTNDRLLLLVDGVEQNELSTNTVYLSRQYSLTNVDRVEVIYGPASTMYGANAYTGVISILTREAETLVPQGKRFGVVAQTTYGGYGTRSADVTLAGKNASGTIAWSLTGNVQQSAERDLSRFDEWDYTYRNVDYRSLMRLTGANADEFAERGGCDDPSPYWTCSGSAAGQRTIELTDAGAEMLRERDRAGAADNDVYFEEGSRNWSFFGKVRFSNLTLGIETWSSSEQVASSILATLLSGRTSWTPHATALYVKYVVPLERVKLNLFTRYEHSGVKRSRSRTDYLHNFASGYLNPLSFFDPCETEKNEDPADCPANVWVEKVSNGSLSTQLRTEANVVYEPSERMSGVAGVELATSSIQRTFDVTVVDERAGEYFAPAEHVGHTDFAVFAQGSWRVRPELKAVVAGRLGYSVASDRPDEPDFGLLFAPRAALIYSPFGPQLVLKAIYAEAYKNPTDFQRYGTVPDINDYPADGLKPERVRNLEFSAGWEPNRNLSIETSVYQSRYSDVVGLGLVPDCDNVPARCQQYQNRDELLIRGLQLSARYRRGRSEVWSHYTHTDPIQKDAVNAEGEPFVDENGNELSDLAVADIASNRLAAGAELSWHRWRFGVRGNYVGARRAGFGTTAPRNIHSAFDAYQTAGLTVSYDVAPSSRLQLIVHNLLDAQYYDPGAEPRIHAHRVLQPGRAVYLRLIYNLR